MKRPEKHEYNEFYQNYVNQVTEEDVVSSLEKQIDEVTEFFTQIPEDKHLYAYGEGKWTIKEIIGHINDAERVFAYRAFRIGRGDQTALSGFDENFYVENASFNKLTIAEMLEEFTLLRQSNLRIFANLEESDWDALGVASDFPISLRALAFIMIGHPRHHLNILKERYLS